MRRRRIATGSALSDGARKNEAGNASVKSRDS